MDSLTKRRDNRSVEVFSENIKDYTERERVYAEAFRLTLCEMLSCEVDCYDTGVDNTGKLIKSKLPNNNCDYTYQFESRKLKVEICTAPLGCKNFLTFKVNKLERILANGEVLLVTKPDVFIFFKLEAVQWMLDNLEHKIHPKFSPNDKAVRLYNNERINLPKASLYEKKWSSQAYEFVSKNKSILLRSKRED